MPGGATVFCFSLFPFSFFWPNCSFELQCDSVYVDDVRYDTKDRMYGRVRKRRQGLGLDQISNIRFPLARSRVSEKMMSRVGLGFFILLLEGRGEEAKGYD